MESMNLQNHTRKNAKAFCVLTLITAVLSTAMRTLIAAKYTDTHTGVYERGSFYPLIYGYVLAAFIIGLILWAVFSKATFAEREYPKSTVFSVFMTAAMGFMMLACAGVFLFVAVSQKNSTVFEIIIIIFGFLSAIYYLSVLFSRRNHLGLSGFMSMAMIVFTIVVLVELYFDMTILVSSPNRIFNQLAYLSLMVFLLAETRVELYYQNTLLYAPAGAAASIILLSSSIPNLIFLRTMSVGNTDRPIIYAVQLVAGLYAVSRLISFCFFSEPISKSADDDTDK